MEQGTIRLKTGLAEMLKGGVIMDVTTPEQAKIAEEAGACAVMALERVPADIRAAGGVARMADPTIVKKIMEVASIPVMAKARIGHFVEARILEALGVDYIDESEVLTPADDRYHIDKRDFTVPFVCGCRNLGEALRRVQVAGVVVLLLGLGLFFNERLTELFQIRDGYGLGLALSLTAAVVWAVYGLAQRILLREMAPPRIMRVLYTCCALALFPFATPSALLRLDTAQSLCLAYCCLNTLVAYGAFSRAMSCWNTAKVSAILTLTPLFTLAFAQIFHLLAPSFFPADPLNWLGYGGALVVVCGAGLIAVGPLLHLPALPHRH